MFQSTIYLPAYCIRQLITLLNEYNQHKVMQTNFLNKNIIDEKILKNPLVFLPWDDFYQLIKQTEKILNSAPLSLIMGERLLINTQGTLGFAITNSKSIRHAVALLETFLPLRTSLISIKHQIKDNYFLIQIIEKQSFFDIKHLIIETVVLAIKRLIDYLTMTISQVSYASFSFLEKKDSHLASQLFQCPINYNQTWDGIAIALPIVDTPLPMADDTTCAFAVSLCQKELDKIEQKTLLSQKIYHLLLENQTNFPSLDAVASHFHLTPRTLHRHLLKEKTTYRELTENVKHTLAISYLRQKKISIQEIAFTLGYHDVANFRRAFKRWEGIAPSTYIQCQKS